MANKKRLDWEIVPSEARDPLWKYHYYVPGVVVSHVKKLIFVSGRSGVRKDSNGNVLNRGDIVDQTKTAIERVKDILEPEGATLDDVVQVTVFLADVKDRARHAEIRSQYFKMSPPASTLVGVKLAGEGMLVEINAIAVL